MPKFDDFDLNVKQEKATDTKGDIQPQIGSRYACTPGSCWKAVCFTTTYK